MEIGKNRSIRELIRVIAEIFPDGHKDHFLNYYVYYPRWGTSIHKDQ
jgi:hypothetical protein